MKRIMLFLATNLAIVVVLGIVLRLLGIDSMLEPARHGPRPTARCSSFRPSSASPARCSRSRCRRWTAKRMMGVRVITQPANATESWLLNTVQRQAQQAGIGMPEVGIFDSPEPNAFATGARRDAALVAVSTGLLQSMSQQEAEAVLGHEVSHVANGDMVTLALIQGVVNTFVVFLARVDRPHGRSHGVPHRARSRPGVLDHDDRRRDRARCCFATMIVMWFSRQREFRADAGGARLAGRAQMIGALERLRQRQGGPAARAARGVRHLAGHGAPRQALFMSHPPLEAAHRRAARRQLTRTAAFAELRRPPASTRRPFCSGAKNSICSVDLCAECAAGSR